MERIGKDLIMNYANFTKMNNEKIIASAIDKCFGEGSYEKVKNCREAVEVLLDYLINGKSKLEIGNLERAR